MKQSDFTILSNSPVAKNTYMLRLAGDTSAITAPGQFVQLSLPGKFLRRPISVCKWDQETLTLCYKAVGAGTELLSTLPSGASLNVLTGLGNGFDLRLAGSAPLLIGGGAGVTPLYMTAVALQRLGLPVQVLLGFNTAGEVFLTEDFRALGIEPLVATLDGSLGHKGFVTDLLPGLEFSFFYTCGPLPMFRAIARTTDKPGQFSLEERMGCGFGACMGCTIQTAHGAKRVCKDGPVFSRDEVIL